MIRLVAGCDEGQQAVVLGAAGGAVGQMQADARETCLGLPSAEPGLDVAFEHRAGDPAAGVAVIDLEDCCEEGATARQEAPPTTAASAPASSTLRFRSTPCETTV